MPGGVTRARDTVIQFYRALQGVALIIRSSPRSFVRRRTSGRNDAANERDFKPSHTRLSTDTFLLLSVHVRSRITRVARDTSEACPTSGRLFPLESACGIFGPERERFPGTSAEGGSDQRRGGHGRGRRCRKGFGVRTRVSGVAEISVGPFH